MAQERRIVWLNVVTVISAAILIGAEVFGAAFAGSWAIATLFDLGNVGARVLDIVFVLCGFAVMVWALENPKAGIVEADEMDFRRCLEVQLPYLGPVIGTYTDWTPLTGRPGLFPEDIDKRDAWQFRNVLLH